MAAIAGSSKTDVSFREEPTKDASGTWQCTYCSMQERYDYKGSKPPFAKHLSYAEDCYIMKDPFSPPNKGEVLVLGADCSFCNSPVCLTCSIFYYTKRFCQKCAKINLQHLPTQLHKKVKDFCEE